jgi:two-component system chemotaxis response regulator CheY
MRRIMMQALRGGAPITSVEVSDGHAALEQLGEGVGLVITDWNLPGISGLELLRSLRARSETSKIRVVIVTSRHSREDVEQAVQLGVNAFVVRPFTMEALTDHVRLLIPVEAGTEAGNND